ncbi:MAG: dual specificity protein phosphatase family protein [Tatlockia sp.]|nr:dual specificity protein phosphatase family protein [Tatlockia sp.]
MSKSDYLSFFSLPEIGISDKVFFGVSHFFNRAKVRVGCENYDEILHNSNNNGRLLLGQLPVDTFITDLLKELSTKGLIVSCIEPYEGAGSSTVIDVIKPFAWQPAGIDHYHLPFIDFSDEVNPVLALEALAKILEVYQDGGTVYIHCKAGRSRSPLIATLFMAILELKVNNQRKYDEETLGRLLRRKIAKLTTQRPQTSIDEEKINQGVKILKLYLQNPALNLDLEEAYTQSPGFFAKLTQAPHFKALWYFAYNNSQYLACMQTIMDELYHDPLNVLAALNLKTYEDSELVQACKEISKEESGRSVLNHLKHFLLMHKDPEFQPGPSRLTNAYKQFNDALGKYDYADNVINSARELQSDIFLSPERNEDKVLWLESTAKFLNDPINCAQAYYKNAENAVLSDNPAIRRLGQSMVIFGAVTLATIFLAGVISSSTFTLPVIISIGLASLAFIMLGKYVMDRATENTIRDRSRELVNEVEENYIESVQFQ